MTNKGRKPPRFNQKDEKTVPAAPLSGQRDASKRPRHAHDAFELEIEVDTEMTEIHDAPGQTGVTQPTGTTEPSIYQPEEKTQIEEMLDLPRTSEEEVLPFFVPSDRPPPRKIPLPPSFDLSEDSRPGDSEDDELLSLFEDQDEPSLSAELPPVHPRPGFDAGWPAAPPSRTSSPSPVSPSPGVDDLAGAGEIGGVEPLDISEFESRRTRRRRQENREPARSSGYGRSAPMAHPSKVVRRRFRFDLRDLVLLLFVLVLAAAVYVAWIIYQDYRAQQELERLERSRTTFEKSKDEAIEKTAPKKEREIP